MREEVGVFHGSDPAGKMRALGACMIDAPAKPTLSSLWPAEAEIPVSTHLRSLIPKDRGFFHRKLETLPLRNVKVGALRRLVWSLRSMANVDSIATFAADAAALIEHEAAVLSPTEISQIEGIVGATSAKVEADVVASKDPIPDIVAGLNQVDAIIHETAPCFVTATKIATSRGDVAVEDINVGDLVVTSSREYRPIRWIGHRTVNPRAFHDPASAMPIRIVAHAFAENRPARDLVVSPGHSLCVDVVGEVLITDVAL